MRQKKLKFGCGAVLGITVVFLMSSCVKEVAAAPRELPLTDEHPELYKKLDIVPMPKQIFLLDKNTPLAGARLVTGPAATRCEQSVIGADFINAAIKRLGGAALPVTDDPSADAAGWSVIIGTRTDNPLVESAVSDGLADVGKDNPGERGYEIRVDEKNKRVYLAGADEIGTLYACVTFAELIRNNNGTTEWQAAEVRDWPDVLAVLHANQLGGPNDPLVWRLLLPLCRKYAWAEGEIPSFTVDEREAYLNTIKAEYDRLLRWKVSGVVYPQTFRSGENYRPLEIYDILREGIEYGKSRGFAAVRYSEAPITGSIKQYPELGEKCNISRGNNYGWCEDAIREDTAVNLAKAIAHIGYTDVGFHDVDTGSYIDNPSGWENRCGECRERWGDDFAEAQAHKHMAYIEAINALAPEVKLHLTITPYFIEILDPEAGRSHLRARFGASADVDELANQQRERWGDVWRQWDQIFPDNVTLVFRESTPAAIKAFTDLAPNRAVFWWLAYLSRAWTSQYSDRPSMLNSYIRGKNDVVWGLYGDLLAPATMLATIEYAWNLRAPGNQPWTGGAWTGGQPILEHWRRGEPRGAVFDVILPHVVNNMFGREMGPYVTKALRQNISPAQVFGYHRARMERFDSLTTYKKMAWQAQNAATAAAAMDRAWDIFSACQDRGMDIGPHATAWLVYYREMFHAAALMADIRKESKLARELARAQDEEGARAAIASGEEKLAAAPSVMEGLYQERIYLSENPILRYADQMGPKLKVNHFVAYMAKGADFSYAGEELAETLKEIPGLIAMGGVPSDILDQLARPRTVRATTVTESIVLDGKLDENAWQGAFPQESFFITGTKRDIAQAFTRARLLYDSEYLYIGVTAYAPSADVPISDKDVFEVFLQHPGIGQDYIHLFVYPDGRLRQQYNSRREGTEGIQTQGTHAYASDNDWIFDGEGMDVAVQREAYLWTTEFRIPLAAVKADKVDERMTINLCRIAPLATRTEASSIQTPPITRSFHDPVTFLPIHPVGAESSPPPAIEINAVDVTRETHTMADAVGTVMEFRLELEADTVLHNLKITSETYDERGGLHERRELATIPRVFFRWTSDGRVSVRFTSEVKRGGVRMRLRSDESESEYWIRFGGWEGTPQAGALFESADKEGGNALAGACFFRADG